MIARFKLRGFHFARRATRQHPVPVTSPFYEDKTGLEQLYYRVRRATGNLKVGAFHEVLRLSVIFGCNYVTTLVK